MTKYRKYRLFYCVQPTLYGLQRPSLTSAVGASSLLISMKIPLPLVWSARFANMPIWCSSLTIMILWPMQFCISLESAWFLQVKQTGLWPGLMDLLWSLMANIVLAYSPTVQFSRGGALFRLQRWIAATAQVWRWWHWPSIGIHPHLRFWRSTLTHFYTSRMASETPSRKPHKHRGDGVVSKLVASLAHTDAGALKTRTAIHDRRHLTRSKIKRRWPV